MMTRQHGKKILEEIGKRTRAIRILRGHTKEGFAEALGISSNQLTFVENGNNRRLSALDLIRIARALDVSTSTLTGETSYSEEKGGENVG